METEKRLECIYCGAATSTIATYTAGRHVPGPVCGECSTSSGRRRAYTNLRERKSTELKGDKS